MVSSESSLVGTAPLIPEIRTDLVQEKKSKIDIHLPSSRREIFKLVIQHNLLFCGPESLFSFVL